MTTPMTAPAIPPPADAGRLRWHCRRGMKELDILLERYLVHHFTSAGPRERAAFVSLLEHEDPDLWSWIVGAAAPPNEFADVVDRLRLHH